MDRHLQLRFVLGTITEWGIVAWLGWQLLKLLDAALEWICLTLLSTTTAVTIALILFTAFVILTILIEGSVDEDSEGDSDDLYR